MSVSPNNSQCNTELIVPYYPGNIDLGVLKGPNNFGGRFFRHVIFKFELG